MSAARTAARRGRQGGVAAVEFALILPLLLSLLSVMVLIVQAFLYYNAMQDAVQSAARFMAATSVGDMNLVGKRIEAVAATRQIVMDAAAASGLPAFQAATLITVMCDANPCDNNTMLPAMVRVFVLPFELPFGVLQGARVDIGGNFKIGLDATVPYGG